MELESIINVSSNQESTYRALHEPAIIIGSCFGVVASFLSIYLITKHLRSYTNPAEQKWIVAVLLMVPVYATESVISLSYAKLSLACDILRSCYEAFALYAFGRYLIACLGGEGRVADFLEDNSEKQLSDQSNSEKQLTEPLMEGVDDNEDKQERPFYHFFFRPYTIGEDLLKIEKFGLVQYMILKTVCALLAIVLELFGVYGDGEFEWNCGYPYLAFVMNFSQMWALYCLVQFYNVTHERLKPIKPLAKFISFKAIVFATWWQGVGIALLCTFGVLPKEGKFQTGLQDFLICIEMTIAAVAHIFVFPVESYKFISVAESGKVTAETIKTEVKIEGEMQKPTKLEKTETMVKAPGTSIKESVQDIVVEGGQHVVEDVALTINQAIGPVEKGVTKIQETLHRKSGSNDEDEEETTLEVEEHVEKRNGKDEEEFRIQVEEHVEKIKSQ